MSWSYTSIRSFLKSLLVELGSLLELLLESVGVVSVTESDGKSLGLRGTLTDISSNVVNPRSVRTNVRLENRVGKD